VQSSIKWCFWLGNSVVRHQKLWATRMLIQHYSRQLRLINNHWSTRLRRLVNSWKSQDRPGRLYSADGKAVHFISTMAWQFLPCPVLHQPRRFTSLDRLPGPPFRIGWFQLPSTADWSAAEFATNRRAASSSSKSMSILGYPEIIMMWIFHSLIFWNWLIDWFLIDKMSSD